MLSYPIRSINLCFIFIYARFACVFVILYIFFLLVVGYCEQIQIKIAHEVNTITGLRIQIVICSLREGLSESQVSLGHE